MLLFLLSLGGIPFVAGSGRSSTCSGGRPSRGSTGWCWWAPSYRGALFYSLLVAKRMYIEAPDKTAPVTAPFLLNFSIFLCVAGVVGFGVYPKPLVMAARRAASSLF